MVWFAVGCTRHVAPAEAEPAAARVTDAVRLVSWNIETVGDPGTAQYDAALQVLAHLDADVVALQEVQWSTDEEWIAQFAADAGYDGVVTGWPVSYGDDTQLILTRLPVSSSAVLDGDTLSGDPLANDLTRSIVTATLDAYGTPLVVATGHFKASDSDVDEFRRSVDAQRAASVLGDDPTAAAVFCGDFNDDLASPNWPATFVQSPVGLPGGYHLGADLVAELPHGLPNSPFTPFTAAGWVVVDAAQRDGSTVTRPVSSRRLDYFVTSAALADSALAEVYDTHDLG
ncbi:MAG: endonuclease/exonuclease/phosphatase family protein, partial [Myxococcota bacterium]